MKLLGNSVKVFDHGNWRLVYNAICLPVLTYGSPIWFKQQNQLLKILQDVQDEAVRWMLGASNYTVRLIASANCYFPNLHPAPVVLKGCSIHTTNHPEQLTASPATRLMVQHGRTQRRHPPYYTQGQAHPTLPDLIGLSTEPHDHILVFLRLIQLRLFSYTPFNKLCSMTGPGGRGA